MQPPEDLTIRPKEPTSNANGGQRTGESSIMMIGIDFGTTFVPRISITYLSIFAVPLNILILIHEQLLWSCVGNAKRLRESGD